MIGKLNNMGITSLIRYCCSVCLYSLIAIVACSDEALAEDFSFYIESREWDLSNVPPRRSYRDDLFVSYRGMEVLITNENLQGFHSKEIFSEVDLDQDGFNEVILKMHHGGNCCGYEYAVVSYRGGNFFSIAEHPELDGVSFPSVKVIGLASKPTLQVINIGEGTEGSFGSAMNILEFVSGELRTVSKTLNAAVLPAMIEVNASEFDPDAPSDIIREFDADDDGIADRLICRYWARWLSIVCEVESSKFGLTKENYGCKRVGVLSTQTNGLKDLVCNRLSVLKFDGERFVSSED